MTDASEPVPAAEGSPPLPPPGTTPLALAIDGAVGHITLDRPEKLNALSRSALEDLTTAASWFDTAKDVKVVVIRGAGRAFCAGFDLQDRPWVELGPPERSDPGHYVHSHVCHALRWLTGAEATRVYADYDNFTGAPIPSSTALVQIRMSNRTIAQIVLCYEIGPSGFGTRRNNQYTIVGTEGSIFWDLDVEPDGQGAGAGEALDGAVSGFALWSFGFGGGRDGMDGVAAVED